MPEPCCPVGHCQYAPRAIGFYRRLRLWCRDTGEEPAEAAWTFVAQGVHDAGLIVCLRRGYGRETSQQDWAARLADVARAEAAGQATTEEVARHLCPFALAETETC